MYHQCDEPYDVEADGGFGQPINLELAGVSPDSATNLWRGIISGILLTLLVVGAPIAFFMDAVPLGWLCLIVGAAGLARVWTVSTRR